MNTCQASIYVEGSARPGTQASVYDPCNVLGGARYHACGKEAVTKYRGHWYCEKHLKENKSAYKSLDKQSAV
jgi:hypothetical protein